MYEHMKFYDRGKIGDKLSNVSLQSVIPNKEKPSKTQTACPCAVLPWEAILTAQFPVSPCILHQLFITAGNKGALFREFNA